MVPSHHWNRLPFPQRKHQSSKVFLLAQMQIDRKGAKHPSGKNRDRPKPYICTSRLYGMYNVYVRIHMYMHAICIYIHIESEGG